MSVATDLRNGQTPLNVCIIEGNMSELMAVVDWAKKGHPAACAVLAACCAAFFNMTEKSVGRRIGNGLTPTVVDQTQ